LNRFIRILGVTLVSLGCQSIANSNLSSDGPAFSLENLEGDYRLLEEVESTDDHRGKQIDADRNLYIRVKAFDPDKVKSTKRGNSYIEFKEQKNGLTHSHLLTWESPSDKDRLFTVEVGHVLDKEEKIKLIDSAVLPDSSTSLFQQTHKTFEDDNHRETVESVNNRRHGEYISHSRYIFEDGPIKEGRQFKMIEITVLDDSKIMLKTHYQYEKGAFYKIGVYKKK